jgi:3-deoxy-D-arabino-heptulosonate 7-phosphate (DAHP) synthase
VVEAANRLLNPAEFAEEIERVEGTRARADTIASRTAKYMNEKMEEDPAYYKKFSKMLEEIIEQVRLGRLTDVQYLRKVTEVMNPGDVDLVASYADILQVGARNIQNFSLL